MTTEHPVPPALDAEGAALFEAVVSAYELGPGEPALLEAACRAWGRHQEAQVLIDAEGLVAESKQGTKAHPALAVADRMAQLTARLLRQLRVETPPEDVVKIRGGGGRPATTRARKAA